MGNGEGVKFNYPEVVANRYIYRGGEYNKNALKNYGRTKHQIGLESAWGTF